MIDPKNREQLTKAMHRVLTDRTLRESMIKAGSQRVLRFNWYRVARGVLAVYYEVYQRQLSQPSTVRTFIPKGIWKALRTLEGYKTAILDEKRLQGFLASKRS